MPIILVVIHSFRKKNLNIYSRFLLPSSLCCSDILCVLYLAQTGTECTAQMERRLQILDKEVNVNHIMAYANSLKQH